MPDSQVSYAYRCSGWSIAWLVLPGVAMLGLFRRRTDGALVRQLTRYVPG